MFNSSPWFSTPKLPERLTIVDVIVPIGGDISSENPTTASDKALKEFVKKLQREGKLRDIEWLMIFNREEEFKALNPAELQAVTKLLWEYLFKTPTALRRALKQIMRGYEQGYQSFSESLASKMPSNGYLINKEIDKQRLAWVSALKREDKVTCARICMNKHCSIHKYVDQLGYSANAPYIKEIYSHAVTILPMPTQEREQDWWLKCESVLSRVETILQLELLLTKINHVEDGSKFDVWAKKACFPESSYTLWYELSDSSKSRLKSFYNITNYDVVKTLLSKLRDTSIDPSLEEWESRNLKRRIDFWSDYSNSFKRVRFILTARSYDLLKNKFDMSGSRITVMENTSLNNHSEVCIFEFDNCYIVERFRNDYDMGILKKSQVIENLLFVKEIANASQITTIAPDFFHDHINDWQYFAKEYLRKKCWISPNKSSRLDNWSTPPPDRIRTRKEKLALRYMRKSTYY
ncbi:EH signature domain-containing protein [Photobacterium sagamiensis]|uniref:EH signature domain-containing protein n=1 Tax=Photobacterium sagamiensis TaxID=2910241 RepID=UPI003D14A03B